jgi:hypothetical protein
MPISVFSPLTPIGREYVSRPFTRPLASEIMPKAEILSPMPNGELMLTAPLVSLRPVHGAPKLS